MSGHGTAKKGELSPKAQYLIERHGSVIFMWLALVFMSFQQAGRHVLAGGLSANDDYMRLAEIRDWLGGQSWWDMHQYRLYPADPLNSHWSRIPDLLIGGPIKLLSPLVGQTHAELIMAMVWPALMLLAYLYLASALVGVLNKNRAGPVLTALVLGLSFGAMSQFGLGRIDHHALQIILALATMYCLITSTHALGRIVLAGLFCALGLTIGIESVPYVAAAIISVVLIWVFDEDKATRKLRAFGLSLAAFSVLGLLINRPPSAWFAPACDTLSVVYIQLVIFVAISLWVMSRAGYKINSAFGRLALATLLGGLCLGATLGLYPECLHGPYSGMPERLKTIWLSNVSEAGNFPGFARNKPVAASAALFMPLLALLSYVLIAVREKGGLLPKFRTPFVFVVLTTLVGLVQMRSLFFATAMALPLAVYLLLRLVEAAGDIPSRPLRILAIGAIVAALSPISLPLIVSTLSQSTEIKGDAAAKAEAGCTDPAVLKVLQALPPGTVLSQIDLGAPLLKFTHLHVTSAPYHRAAEGIMAALDSFTGSEEEAREISTRLQADYIIACVSSAETELEQNFAPDGFLARLQTGQTPDWLEKISTPADKSLLVYRIKTPQP